MKYLYGLFTLLFAVFAIVQWNDPDSIMWILMYVVITALFGLAAFGRYFEIPTLAITGVCLVITLIHVPGLIDFITNDDGIKFSEGMQNTYPYIEKAREFGGALIATLATGWLYLRIRDKV